MGDGMSKAVVCSFEEEDATSRATGSTGTRASQSEVVSMGTNSGALADTLIIFDWDDTLLCSSAINSAQWTLAQLQQLERIVETVLKVASELGDVMIVTNGNGSWVHDSSHRFLPGLVPALESVNVMSARADWEQAYPGDPFAWKRQAFKHIVKCRQAQSSSPQSLNLVVLGDSPAEMEAAHSAVKALELPALVKTIKFRENPTASQLLGQLHKVAQELRGAVEDCRGISRDLAPVHMPNAIDDLDASAFGWKLVPGRDWKCSQTFLDALFSGDADEDIPLELPDWMVSLADRMTTWQKGLAVRN